MKMNIIKVSAGLLIVFMTSLLPQSAFAIGEASCATISPETHYRSLSWHQEAWQGRPHYYQETTSYSTSGCRDAKVFDVTYSPYQYQNANPVGMYISWGHNPATARNSCRRSRVQIVIWEGTTKILTQSKRGVWSNNRCIAPSLRVEDYIDLQSGVKYRFAIRAFQLWLSGATSTRRFSFADAPVPDTFAARADLVVDPIGSYVNESGLMQCVVKNNSNNAFTGLFSVNAYFRSPNEASSNDRRVYWESELTLGGNQTKVVLIEPPSDYPIEDSYVNCSVNQSQTNRFPLADHSRPVLETNYNNNDYDVLQPPSNLCFSNPVLSEDPECWLNHNSNVLNALTWQRTDHRTYGYRDWSMSQRSDLRRVTLYYIKYLQDYPAGFPQNQQSLETPDIMHTLEDPHLNLPQNIYNDRSQNPRTVLSEKDAWRNYIKYVGLQLATEITNEVPWSILSYSDEALEVMFSSRKMVEYFANWGGYRTINPGYSVNGGATPTSAIKVRNWLHYNNLIKNTRRDTIIAVTDWARRLLHADEWNNLDYTEQASGYRGSSAIYKMLIGHSSTFPGENGRFQRNTTFGCHTTSQILNYILRAVNIPVNAVNGTGGHSTIHFITEGDQYIAHADDLYLGGGNYGIPVPSVENLIINQQEYDQWVNPENQAESGAHIRASRIKRRFVEPTESGLISEYCDDLDSGLNHANGGVLNWFRFPNGEAMYSLQQLENSNLWGRMDQAINQVGGCNAARQIFADQRNACFALPEQGRTHSCNG